MGRYENKMENIKHGNRKKKDWLIRFGKEKEI